MSNIQILSPESPELSQYTPMMHIHGGFTIPVYVVADTIGGKGMKALMEKAGAYNPDAIVLLGQPDICAKIPLYYARLLVKIPGA